jgi:hypothetical protein
MLQNLVAGNEAMFRSDMFWSYLSRPTIMNIYIMVDPRREGPPPRTAQPLRSLVWTSPATSICSMASAVG